MTVIRPNSVSGITSITAQANEINFFRSNGTLAGLQLNGVNFNTTAGISTFAALKVTGNLDVEGVLTYQDVTNVDSVGIITARSTIDAQGDVSIADKIIHTGDTNTAIRFPANDTITFETAGGERLRIASDGEATFAATNINVNRNAGDAFISLQTSGTSNVALYGGSSSGFRVFTKPSGGSLTERLRTTPDGRISINDSSPTSNETLTIKPNGNIACDVSLKMNTNTDSRIKFYDSGGTWRGGFAFTEYANSTDYPNFHDSFYFLTDPSSNGSLSTAMRINNAGCFMYPNQPCFSVTMSSDYYSSTTHVANFNTERFDQGNNFNTGSNGIFTAPVTGKYYMHAAIQTMSGGASQTHIMGVAFLVNGSVQSGKGSGDQYLGRDADHYITVHNIRILNLAQGDTVQVYIQLHAQVQIEGSGGTDRCNWQGYLMA